MFKECQKCGEQFKVKPSRYDRQKYCSRECSSKKVTAPCTVCSNPVTRYQSRMLSDVFCSPECTKKGKSQRFKEMNKVLNPTRMDLATRTKLREAKLNKGSGKSYEKTFGRHTHRIVAEEKLGRLLEKNEVVHHIDGNKRNNDPANLEILSSQAEHARIHILIKNPKRKKC